MRRMRVLQAFIVMMFALVFAGKGKVDVFAANGPVLVNIENGDNVYQLDPSGGTPVDGLSWNGNKNELTLENYTGGYISIYTLSEKVEKCTIKVEGENTIKASDSKMVRLIGAKGVDLVFTGDGTLNMIMSDDEGNNATFFEQSGKGSVTINGPKINIKGSKNEKGTIVANEFNMIKGSLDIECMPEPTFAGAYLEYYSALNLKESFYMDDGTINIEYIYPKEYEDKNPRISFGENKRCAIYMGEPYYSSINGGTINLKVPDKLKDLLKLTEKERGITFSFAGDEKEYTSLETIKGLTWDEEKNVLTMDGYNGESINIKSDFMEESIDVVVKGTNTITGDEKGIVSEFVNLNFTGDGSLIIDMKEGRNAITFSGDCTLKIDGPTIDIVGKITNPIWVSDFIMNSGTLNMEVYAKAGERYYAAIRANNKVKINGGTILVKYVGEGVTKADPAIAANKFDTDEFYNPGGADNCTIILVADETVISNVAPFGCYDGVYIDSDAPQIEVGPKVVITKKTPIDISNYKVTLSETKYVYDGKEKKPEVKVADLVENKDFTVKYENNINPGKATVIITGRGMYTGEIKVEFTIEKAASEKVSNEKVSNGPEAGSKVKDSNYIYKVIKAGTKDGKVVGEVSVIGLNKKSLKKIKIANVVTIDNVKYKVTQIGAKAFKGNKKIKSVVIGKNVTEIGKNAFFGCINLKKVNIKSTVLKKVGKKAFYRKKGKKITFAVPKKFKKKYAKKIKKAKTNNYKIK